MMDEKLAMVLLFIAIMVLLAIVFLVMLICSEANFRGWEEGRQENEHYHRLTVDIMKGRIEARECALAMYRDISTTLCDNMSDCMYCPYERDKDDSRCALWELNEAVKRMDIDEVHVDTKHDRGDCD